MAILAGLGAALCWALGAMLAHSPVRVLGPFDFTRTQLISATVLLLALATGIGAWEAVSWAHWPTFLVAGIVGVLVSNLAMAACLDRAGPRRSQLLETSAAPIAALMAWAFLGETLSGAQLLGGATMLAGVAMAVSCNDRQTTVEPISGSWGMVLVFGLIAAAAQAAGIVALKPALDAGSDPIAVSALRTSAAALAISLVGLWPSDAVAPRASRTGGIVLMAILPGILGYVVAVSLLMLALKSSNAATAMVLASTTPVLMLPLVWLVHRRAPRPMAWLGAALVVVGAAVMAIAR